MGGEESSILSFITSIPSEVPFAGLLALVIVAVIRGWLLPRNHLIDLRADFALQLAAKDKEIEHLREDRDARLQEVRQDRDARVSELQSEVRDWREAQQAGEVAMAVLRKQNGELLEVARTAEHVLRATFGSAGGQQRQIGGDVDEH